MNYQRSGFSHLLIIELFLKVEMYILQVLLLC